MHCVALARWIVRMHKVWPPNYSGQLYARRQLVKLTGALHSASKSRVAVLSSRQLQMASQDPPTTASTSSGVLAPRGITAVTGSSLDPALFEALRAAVQREIRAALPQVASASTPSDSAGTPAASITVGQTSNVR